MLKLGIDPEKLYRATFICQCGLCCCNMTLISCRLFHKILDNLWDFLGAKGSPPLPRAKNFLYIKEFYIALWHSIILHRFYIVSDSTTNWLTDWLNGWLKWLTYSLLTNQLTDLLMDRLLADWLTQMTNWLTGWLAEWLSHWLTKWTTRGSMCEGNRVIVETISVAFLLRISLA